MKKTLQVLATICSLVSVVQFAEAGAPIDDWRDARFGMFIHWGPVSLKGTEIGWSRGNEVPIEEYDLLYKSFDPVKFNADEWVAVAKDAGMRYIVLTTKHHDGFCLWDTKQTDYNVMNSPFKRDVVKELADACKRQGIGFGTYYSICDWHHPDFPLTSPGGGVRRDKSNLDSYTDYVKAQVKELLSYGPLFTLWFDVPQEFDSVRGQSVIDLARSIQPNIVVNNRSGAPGDYDTPEQSIGGFNSERPWETCMTLCTQWAWKPDDRMKSLKECIQTLLRTIGGDGNLLFNVGPMPSGEIEQRQVERLKEMGAFVRKYEESIYGTRGGPFKPGSWGVSVYKGNTIYLHVMNWPGENPLVLPAVGLRILRSESLTGGTVDVAEGKEETSVSVSPGDRHEIDTIIKLETSGPVFGIPPVSRLIKSLSTGKKATASNRYRNMSEYDASKAVDGDPESRWATDEGTKTAWLEVDLGEPTTVGGVGILEECGSRVRKFDLQAKVGDEWKTVYSGASIGPNFEQKIPPVTAREFRLNILEAGEGPTISEFRLMK